MDRSIITHAIERALNAEGEQRGENQRLLADLP